MGENDATEGKALSADAMAALMGQAAVPHLAEPLKPAPTFEQQVLEALSDIKRRLSRIEQSLP